MSTVGEKTEKCSEVQVQKTITLKVASAPQLRIQIRARDPTLSFAVMTESDAAAEAAFEKSLRAAGYYSVFLNGKSDCDKVDFAPAALRDNDPMVHPIHVEVTALTTQSRKCEKK